jgi:hypothetical protein
MLSELEFVENINPEIIKMSLDIKIFNLFKPVNPFWGQIREKIQDIY